MQLRLKEIEISEAVIKGEDTIWGVIYFQNGNFCFPDDEWFDCVSAVLCMWAEDIVEFVENRLNECTMYFMDGPFTVKILRLEESNEALMVFEENEQEVHKEKVALPELIALIQGAISKFLELSEGLESRSCIKILNDYKAKLLQMET